MEEKNPTTTEDRRHEARPEHKILTDAMHAWKDEAPVGETRSCIVIQTIAKDGELNATSHIKGKGSHLYQAAKACMSLLSSGNPVGAILRQAAIDSLIEIGMLAPRDEAPQPEQPETEPQNNQEHE